MAIPSTLVDMRLSSRLPHGFEPNALTAALARLRSKGRKVLDLTVSNPTRCGFTFPEADIRAALSAPGRAGLRSRSAGATDAPVKPSPPGTDTASGPMTLLLTASTSEAYAWLFKLLGDPGDEVLVPSPSYPLFDWLARLEGAARPPGARLFPRPLAPGPGRPRAGGAGPAPGPSWW